MGNRALIKGINSNLGVYLHWNGGYDSVSAFLEYCRLKGYRSLESDDYGIARLCQVVGNFFGGSTSLGVWVVEKNMSPSIVSDYCLDNGVYEIKDWKIEKHWNEELILSEDEYHEGYELIETLIEIDKSMPIEEQLGRDFLMAKEVDVSELKINDKVYVFDSLREKYDKFIVIGFEKNIPYVNKYERDGKYNWNPNNFIHDKRVRKAI